MTRICSPLMMCAAAVLALCFSSSLLAQGGEPAPAAPAAEAPAKKSADEFYWLLNPTPRGSLREFNSAPEVTERARTVDAGHFEIDLGVLRHAYESGYGFHVNHINLAQVTLKVGVLDFLDLEGGFGGWNHIRTSHFHRETVVNDNGIGDWILAARFNILGNDGCSLCNCDAESCAACPACSATDGVMSCGFALGGYAALKLPSSNDDGFGNDNAEARFLIPVSYTCCKTGLTLFGQTGIDLLAEGENGHVEFINTLGVRRNLCKSASLFVEFTSVSSTLEGDSWQGTANLGGTLTFCKHLQGYFRVDAGLSRATPDVAYGFGLTFRY